jgi:hypothetical protein
MDNKRAQKITHISNLPIEDAAGGGQPAQIPSGPPITSTGYESKSRGPINPDTSYKPLDVYPNPYGIGPPDNGVDFTKPVSSASPGVSGVPSSSAVHPIPSHDIPMNPLPHQIDEQLQPNYIPPFPSTTTDYLGKYQQETLPEIEESARRHRQAKRRGKKWEQLMEWLQIPLLAALLYFAFQLPIVQNMLYKRIGFLPVTGADGQLNMTGLALTSAIFGLCIHGMLQAAEFLGSESS